MVKKLLMGNEAFAHAALEAGVRVVAGYPGTPSSELIETIAAEHAAGRAQDVHVEWSTNEKAALEVCAGASFCGARTLFTCKQVGLNVASDALMSLNYVGIKGGTVLFVADDPGPISSQTEQDTRRFAAFAKVPVLDPSTPEQGFAMIKAAFDLSELYHTPVIVRPTTRINHASTFFDIAEKTCARPVPAAGFERDPRWVIFPKRAWEAHGEINTRLRACAHDFATDAVFAAFNPVLEGGVATDAAQYCTKAENAAHADGAHTPVPEAHSTPRIGIMAGGVSAAYAREALAMLAAKTNLPAYRFMQVGTPYPFPEETVACFVEGLDAVLVLEELDYVLEESLLAYAGRTHANFDVYGKLTGHARDRGENDVDDVAERIAKFFAEQSGLDSKTVSAANLGSKAASVANLDSNAPLSASLDSAQVSSTNSAKLQTPGVNPTEAQSPDLPVRPPVLCAGCPHRGSFYAVKRALGKREAVLCGDIGCYTLGNAKPLDAVDTCLCMGAGITMAQGFALAEPHKKQLAFVGDSTFFASGMTGVANAVYNGHDITICVLDNSTTAMTGGQPHPGIGRTLMGERHEPLSIEKVLRALGVQCIVHTNPLELDDSIAQAREAIDFAGPSAIIFKSPCVQLTRPVAPAQVDSSICTGCKKCITEIGCPGIGFNIEAVGEKSGTRGQAFVDVSLCNGCGLCTQVCPFDALSVPAAAEGGAR